MSNSASIAAAKKRRGGASLMQQQNIPNKNIQAQVPQRVSVSQLLGIHNNRLFNLEKSLNSIAQKNDSNNELLDLEKRTESQLEGNKLTNQLNDSLLEIESLRKKIDMLERNLKDVNHNNTVIKGSLKTLVLDMENERKEREDLENKNKKDIQSLKELFDNLDQQFRNDKEEMIKLEENKINVNEPNNQDVVVENLEKWEDSTKIKDVPTFSDKKKKKGREITLDIKEKQNN